MERQTRTGWQALDWMGGAVETWRGRDGRGEACQGTERMGVARQG